MSATILEDKRFDGVGLLVLTFASLGVLLEQWDGGPSSSHYVLLLLQVLVVY